MIHAAQRQVQEARLRATSTDSHSRSLDDELHRMRLEATIDLLEGYRLEQVLHRGGQGVVYRGVQLSTGRTVAVKLLPLGAFASRNEQLRFEREVQVLSQLESPGIVRIVDSGVAAGHWWFTMDYIDGVPLDEFVRVRLYEPVAGASLTDTARSRLLSIFADVAEAVETAHLHGVIHRDLKPRNILIDKAGHAHVLDFGLAKLNADDSAATTNTMTETGQFLGSLPWASPEQAAGNTALVDLRTDVYSLGVILFQLLTGQFPYRVIGGARDVIQNIVAIEPAAPSSLSASVDDELQTIVLKCLSKDAARRYQSAGELARDLRRYLAGEPIEAKRDSLAYVLRKKLKRHRAAAIVAAAFAVLIVAGSISSLVLWRVAARERDRAVEAEQAQTALRVRAEAEIRKADEVNEFLQRVIAAASPRVAQGRELTVHELMQSAARQLDSGQLAQQTEIEAATRHTIAKALLSLGRFDEAAEQAERALAIRRRLFGADHRDVAASLMQLSEIRDVMGRRQEAVELANEALAILQGIHAGQDHDDVAECLARLAWAKANGGRLAEGAGYLTEAVAMLKRLWGADDIRVLQARVNQTVMSHDIAGSEQMLRQAIEAIRVQYGPRHPDLVPTMKMLAGLLQMRSDFDGAERCFREALELSEAIYGRDHPMYLEGLTHIGRLTSRRGDHAAAASLLIDALDQARQVYGEPSFLLAEYRTFLAGFQALAGDSVEAEASFAAGLAMLRDLGMDQGVPAAKCKLPLCQFLIGRDELAEAEQLAQECLTTDEGAVVPGHWTRASASSMLGEIRLRQARYEEAEQLMLAGYGGLEHQTNLPRGLHSGALRRLAELYRAWEKAEPGQGRQAAAEQWQRRWDQARTADD